MKLFFTREQFQKFDNALDLLSEKGFDREEKHFAPKMIGTTLLTYSVLENPETKEQRLLQMTLDGANCVLRMFEISGGKKSEEIPVSELLK